ncbi:sarcoplasmic/endoplasmic reticulum calcium ATPase regulator DWORF isoform X2 [Eleutherodactylus coqui]
MGEKTMTGTGMAEYRRYLVPALLIAGWFIGCGVMVYVIFS